MSFPRILCPVSLVSTAVNKKGELWLVVKYRQGSRDIHCACSTSISCYASRLAGSVKVARVSANCRAMSLFKFGFSKPSNSSSGTESNSEVHEELTTSSVSQESKKRPADSTSPSPGPAKKKKNTLIERNFQDSWFKEFHWLIYEPDQEKKMKCSLCIKAMKTSNAFYNGSTNFQRSALARHQKTDDHKLAIATSKMATTLMKATSQAQENISKASAFMMNTVKYMVKEEIPDRKFTGLLQFQVCEKFIFFFWSDK